MFCETGNRAWRDSTEIQQFSSDFNCRLIYSTGSYSLGNVRISKTREPWAMSAATLRVAIDFRPIATQVIFDLDWTIIQSVLLYLNISYYNFNFSEYRLEKGFQTLQLTFF